MQTPYQSTLNQADAIIALAVAAGQGTVVYDLDADARVFYAHGFAVFLWDSVTVIEGNDQDGTLTMEVARWVQALPIVGRRRPHVLAWIDRRTEARITIRLAAFVYHEDELDAWEHALKWDTACFPFNARRDDTRAA